MKFIHIFAVFAFVSSVSSYSSLHSLFNTRLMGQRDNQDLGGFVRSTRSTAPSGLSRFVSERTRRQKEIKQARFSRIIRDEMNDIISKCDIRASNFPDPKLLKSTYVRNVEISKDLSNAKITVSVMGNAIEKRKIYVWMCQNLSNIRRSLASRIRNVFRIPMISFKLFDSKMEDLLVYVQQEEMKRKSEALLNRSLDSENVEMEEQTT